MNNVVVFVLKQLVPLCFQDWWEMGRTGCTFLALRYSSMGGKAHLHLLAVEVYRWFVVNPSPSGRKKLFMFNMKHSICAFDANKYRSCWSLKTPLLSIWVESLGALQQGSASKWYQHKHGFKVLGYCGHVHYLKSSLGKQRVKKRKGCFLYEVGYLWQQQKWDLTETGQELSQMLEKTPENFFPGNSAGESLFVKHVNLDFCSEKKGNGKRKLL